MKCDAIYPILMSLVLAVGFGSTANGASEPGDPAIGTVGGYLLSLSRPSEADFFPSADGAISYVDTPTETGSGGGPITIPSGGGGGDTPGDTAPTPTVLAVPEPTSILLLGTGLAGAVAWERRRRKKSAPSK